MRLPLAKPYRAIPELDRFSDADCKLYQRAAVRAQRADRWGRAVAMVLFTFVWIGVYGGCVGHVVAAWTDAALEWLGVPSGAAWGIGIAVPVAILIAVPTAVGVLWRDRWLRREIRRQIGLAVCPRCRYPLTGLTAQRSAEGPNWRATCPECGCDAALPGGRVSSVGVVAEGEDGGEGAARWEGSPPAFRAEMG